MSLPIAFGSYDRDPEKYFIEDKNPLWKAVEIAIQLGRPLLLTGEPGTGKTQLAYYAAKKLSKDKYSIPFNDAPFVFHSKTTSLAKDLFYHYDAIAHFQAEDKTKKTANDFININALGKAILQTSGSEEAMKQYRLSGINNLSTINNEPRSSVVLIDEIDKASRDFPNDLLNEIENNEFAITESNEFIKASTDVNARILVILTSNNEKSLPDAFLRRCVFYHLNFPEATQLLEILTNKLTPFLIQQKIEFNKQEIRAKHSKAVEFFELTRKEKNLEKLPATSELIDWLKILHLENFFNDDKIDFDNLSDAKRTILAMSLYTLFKSEKDVIQINKAILERKSKAVNK